MCEGREIFLTSFFCINNHRFTVISFELGQFSTQSILISERKGHRWAFIINFLCCWPLNCNLLARKVIFCALQALCFICGVAKLPAVHRDHKKSPSLSISIFCFKKLFMWLRGSLADVLFAFYFRKYFLVYKKGREMKEASEKTKFGQKWTVLWPSKE